MCSSHEEYMGIKQKTKSVKCKEQIGLTQRLHVCLQHIGKWIQHSETTR